MTIATTGATEAIWHFAGYLHLIDDLARSWSRYDADPSWRPSDDPTLPTPSPLAAPDLPEMDTRGLVVHPLAFPSLEAGFVALPRARPAERLEPADLIGADREVPDRLTTYDAWTDAWTPVQSMTSTLDHLRAPIEREPGGGETLLDLEQINLVRDRDHFVSGDDIAAGLGLADPAAELAELIAEARSAVPDSIWEQIGQDGSFLTQLGRGAVDQEDVAAALHARHEALRSGEADESLSGYAVEPGRYADGDRVEADWELPDFEGAPVMPDAKNGDEAVGVQVHLGGNTAQNVAIVQDLNELSLQTVVFGDYVKLDVVVQLNALMDVDDLTTFGDRLAATGAALAGVEPGLAVTAGNRLDNIAAFLREDVDFGSIEEPGFGGLKWQVDVLDGDFWDIKSIYQANYIVDDDYYSKTDYSSFAQIRNGENLSMNFSEFLQYTGNYDLIVIGGNYYGANWIVQANVLLDSDGVLVGHEGGDADVAVSTDRNQLANDATIATYGGGDFVALDPQLAGFVERLLTDDSIDPADWWSLNGIGSAEMRVLYVSGDYFDVNVLQQLNVVSDADTLAQVLPAHAALRDEAPEQWIATGGNALTNKAIIVDTEAAVATHVGGDVYDDSFLVQAEIVIDDDGYDFGLAPELVAFTDDTSTAFDDDDVSVGVPLAGQGDMLGSMLT